MSVLFTSLTSIAVIGCGLVKGGAPYSKKGNRLRPMQLTRYRLAAKNECGLAGEGNGFFTPALLQHMPLDPIPMLTKALPHPEECGGVQIASQVAGPADADAPSPESVEEAEVLEASTNAGSVAQIVVA